MNNYTNNLIFKKVRTILKKRFNEREDEEVHYLSLAFKKKLIIIHEVQDWQSMADCLKSLILVNINQTSFPSQNVSWIYVIKGKFEYHHMVYEQNQSLSLTQNSNNIEFFPDSLYAVLTWKNLEEVKKKKVLRLKEQFKAKTQQLLFSEYSIRERVYQTFWNQTHVEFLKKKEKFSILKKPDTVFVVVNGSLFVEYKWKRLIEVKEIGVGGIFSTYLGRYFNKTADEYKKQEVYNFQYMSTCDNTAIVSFSPDIFFEVTRLFSYKSILLKFWEVYKERVKEVKEIIERVGLMKMQKWEVKQMIERDKLSEKIRSKSLNSVSKNIKRLTDLSFLNKSNRRKVPNLAVKSERKEFKKKNPFNTTLSVAQKMRSKSQFTMELRPNGFKPSENRNFFQRSNTKSTIDLRLETISSERSIQFYKPDQFLSKKLKIQYELVMDKIQNLEPMTKSQERKKMFETQKQYFQSFINEKRIMKLGPKKRTLYQRKLKI